jgi:hypothetical protein
MTLIKVGFRAIIMGVCTRCADLRSVHLLCLCHPRRWLFVLPPFIPACHPINRHIPHPQQYLPSLVGGLKQLWVCWQITRCATAL